MSEHPKQGYCGGKTVLVDLDSTLAEYTAEWENGKIGPPLPTSKPLLEQLAERGYRVVVYSTRTDTKTIDRTQFEAELNASRIWAWLMANKLDGFVDDVWCGDKPLAVAIIDDRGINFNGCVSTVMSELNRLSKTWQYHEMEMKHGE